MIQVQRCTKREPLGWLVGTLLVQIWFLALSMNNCTAQTPVFRFERLSTENGLSSFRAFDLVQDGKGFIWIGTLAALDRFDGYNFMSYRNDIRYANSISAGAIVTLLVDRSGTLWAGTADGVINRFNFFTESFDSYTLERESSRARRGYWITSIVEEGDGRLWIGTRGEGLFRVFFARKNETLVVDSLTNIRHDSQERNSPISNVVYSLLEDGPGRIWIGTADGLDLLDIRNGLFTHYKSSNDPSGIAGSSVWSLYRDKQGDLWIGTDRGLTKFNRKTRRFESLQGIRGDVSCLWEQDDRYLWVGTFFQGLSIIDRQKGTITQVLHDPSDPNSLSNDFVRAIRSYNNDVVWIVTDRGINKYRLRAHHFRHLHHESDRQGFQWTAALHESKDGSIWIGASSLKRIKDGSLVRFTHDPQVPSSISEGVVMAICEDRTGSLWFGTTSGFIENLDVRTQEFRHHRWVSSEEEARIPISTIIESRDGSIWAGTMGAGLVRLSPRTGEFQKHRHRDTDPNSPSHNLVTTILETKDDVLWIGTQGGGLNKYDFSSGLFSRYLRSDVTQTGLSSNNIYDIREASERFLWVATDNGLSRFDRGTETFETITSTSGQIPATILRILEDNNGDLWLMTLQEGLFRFRTQTQSYERYTLRDGLQGVIFFSGAACKKSNGEILVGGENGFNMFHPDSIKLNRNAPKILMGSFRILDEEAKVDSGILHIKHIMLPYDQNYVSFEFAALDHNAPEKNQYAFKLEGLDRDWIHAGTRRYVSYNAVSPGEYLLRVKASNSDGVWNEEGLSIPLIITPPFWQTTWFRGLMVVLFIGLLAAAYNYRVSQLLQVERMRLRIADDLHDDIGSSLSSIGLRMDVVRKHLKENYTKEREHLSTAILDTRHTADALRNLVWMLNPEHDRIDDIIGRMKDGASKLLVNINHSFQTDDHTTLPILDMEFRRNLILIYQETLNNIIKHAKATQVDIIARTEQDAFHLMIVDNGIGFDEETIRKGHGLNSLRHRAEQIGGTLEIQSSPGKGTTIHFVARIPPPPFVVKAKTAVVNRYRSVAETIRRTLN